MTQTGSMGLISAAHGRGTPGRGHIIGLLAVVGKGMAMRKVPQGSQTNEVTAPLTQGKLCQAIKFYQNANKAWHLLERDHVRAIGGRAIRVRMGLDKDTGNADRNCRPCQHRHEFAVAAR